MGWSDLSLGSVLYENHKGENPVSQAGILILFSFVITYSFGVFISSASHLFFPSNTKVFLMTGVPF